MKAQFNASVDVTTIDEVRKRAEEADVLIGDLADLFLRFGLAKMSAAAVREWALKTQKSGGGYAGAGPYVKDERAVLRAFDSLPAKPATEGAWRFSLSDLASESGLRLTNTFWALKKLERRRLVHGMELEEVDRWGRPVKSYWSLVSAMPEHARPKAVTL